MNNINPEVMKKHNQIWFFKFKLNKEFGHLRLKCLAPGYGHGYPQFDLDKKYYDIVDIETFNKIEEDRIPLFVGLPIAGVNPKMESIMGFFNGRKLVGVLSRSSFSTIVGGVSIYECDNGLRNTLITFRNDQPNAVVA